MTTIIDNQLIGRGALKDEDCVPFELKEPIGHWIYKKLRENLKKYGNTTWMVIIIYKINIISFIIFQDHTIRQIYQREGR